MRMDYTARETPFVGAHKAGIRSVSSMFVLGSLSEVQLEGLGSSRSRSAASVLSVLACFLKCYWLGLWSGCLAMSWVSDIHSSMLPCDDNTRQDGALRGSAFRVSTRVEPMSAQHEVPESMRLINVTYVNVLELFESSNGANGKAYGLGS